MDRDWTSSDRLSHQSSGSGASHSLPVFVFPSSLSFYADDSSSFKQILTLYNPYDFAVRFKVLSTAPQKYVVVDPEGHIKARCYVDIVIRISDISSKYFSRADEFRILMYQQASGIESLIRSSSSSSSSIKSQVSGHRDVTATLFPDRPASHKISGDDGKSFETIPGSSSSLLTQSQIFSTGPGSPASPSNSRQIAGLYNNNRSPNYFLILISVAAAVVLMMPNSDAEKPSLMSFLPLPGLHMKLCAAYVLGCITKPLFWP